MRNIWSLRLTTFAVWFLAAGSAAYWGLHISAQAAPNPALARADVAGQNARPLQPDTLAVAHGLGAVGDGAVAALQADSAPTVDWNPSRFALSGIMAQGSEKDGLVMISVDGKPAQLLQVGATVEPSVVVQALSRQSVTLANISQPDSPKLLTLKLGEKSNANTGSSPYSPPPAPAVVEPASTPPVQLSPQIVVPPPAAQAPDAAPDSARQDREERRARLNERLEQRRNAGSATGNTASNTTANPAKTDSPAPRRSVLSDEHLYFGD
jgi:general secretion pathway protein C